MHAGHAVYFAAIIFFSRSTKNDAHLKMRVSCDTMSGRFFGRRAVRQLMSVYVYPLLAMTA